MSAYTICLVVLLIVAIIVIVFLFIRNHRSGMPVLQSNDNSLQPVNIRITDDSKLLTKMVLVNHFADVPFDVAFKQNGLSDVIVRNSLEPVETFFRSILPNAPNGVRIVDSVQKTKEGVVFTLSEAGKNLLKIGKAEIMKTKDGTKWLPQIRGVEDKKIIELFKAKDLSKLVNITKLANAAVGIANIISNLDMVKKLEMLDKKIDFIIAGRHLDKKAELETCYRLVSEIKLICDKGDWEPKLYDIHTKLTNLKIAWKNEIEYKLNSIRNPYEKGLLKFIKEHKKATQFLPVLTRITLQMVLSEGSKDKAIYKAIDEIKELFFLSDFAVLFDFALCSAINHPISLEDDIRTIDLLIEEIKKKKEFLSNRNNDFSLDKYLSYLNHCKEKYQRLMEKRDSLDLPENDSGQSEIETRSDLV